MRQRRSNAARVTLQAIDLIRISNERAPGLDMSPLAGKLMSSAFCLRSLVACQAGRLRWVRGVR